MFQNLTPKEHKLQYERANETSNFAIDGTAFSTVTINYSWRTALHRDSGDFEKGFGNLIVLKDDANDNDYTGCYTGFPQYGVACNIRQGDFVAMDVHEWHCNTEFYPLKEEVTGKWNKSELKNGWYYNRLSVVCYLRENMLRCKNMATNRIQLLKRNGDKNPIFTISKKYPITNEISQFLNISEDLREDLEEFILNNNTDSNQLNELVSNYFGYTGYYFNDFIDELDQVFIDTFISELGIYLSLKDDVDTTSIKLNKNTLSILNKVAKQL